MKVIRGVDQTFTYNLYDDNGNAVDITAYTIAYYIYSDLNVTLLSTIAGAITDAATGEFEVTVTGAITTPLTKYYYPYKILLTDSLGVVSLFELGTLSVNDVTNIWEWDVDILTGKTLADIRADVKDELRYNDWTETKLNSWINKSIEKFCGKTHYIKSRAYAYTIYNQYKYMLPPMLLDIDKILYTDSSGEEKELSKNTDYYRKGNTLYFSDNSQNIEVADDGKIAGGYKITIQGAKYVQNLDSDTDYLEMPAECDDSVTMYTVFRVLREDRRDQEEISIAYKMFIGDVQELSDKNEIDNVGDFSIGSVNDNPSGGVASSGLF